MYSRHNIKNKINFLLKSLPMKELISNVASDSKFGVFEILVLVLICENQRLGQEEFVNCINIKMALGSCMPTT